ncbi:MAG: polysaccharide deacetylase family protein, partial [Bacteroidota bacterium]
MIALMYHDIEAVGCPNEKLGTSAYYYVTSAKTFRLHLEIIRSLHLDVLTLSGYWRAMKEGSINPNDTVILTFDDGHESIERVAMPIMNEFGYAGTTQVIAGFVGKPNKHTLDEQQLHRLCHAGWDIGGPGFYPVVLTELHDGKLEFELCETKRILEQALHKPIEMMSIPHGPYDRRVRSAIVNAGYQASLCSSPGINRTGTDRFSLRRMTVHQRVDLLTFRKIVTRHAPFYLRERLRRFAYLSLQRLLESLIHLRGE